MGTNYYLEEKPPCPTCGRHFERRHIGKSSAGWCFSLRIYPEDGIKTLEDWKSLFHGGLIFNEYGERVGPITMLKNIANRSWPKAKPEDSVWYLENDAEPGPGGLARHKIDGSRCVGHGEGSWDYLIGEFS